MKVTPHALIEVIVTREISTLSELRQVTGAGDGCMACRQRLQRYLDEYSVEICSARIPLAAA
jgi:bacterioferritin-associated ferredoxin